MTLRLLPPRAPPTSETELLQRASQLAGHPLGAIASALGEAAPPDLTRHKGWVGQLLEHALGATAASRPVPDFERLSVELKTIPIDRAGVPRESTFVCTAPLSTLGQFDWASSPVRKKLARVLWIPVEADANIALAERRVGSPLLWSPSAEEEAALRADWDELSSLVAEGWVASITAHRGRYLQIRPKAASARSRTWALNDEGDPIRALPRGFYLRRSFTTALLARHFIHAGTDPTGG